MHHWRAGASSLTLPTRAGILPRMSQDVTKEAAERLEDALNRSNLRDPRDFYRAHLRGLRDRDPQGYERAVRTYHDRLLPRVARPDSDAVGEWLEFGMLLAELSGEGRSLVIDEAGRARPAASPPPRDGLLLYMPRDPAVPVLPLLVPRAPSAAQEATLDLLVHGRTG